MSAIFTSKLRTVFYLLDRNKDGVLSKDELVQNYSTSYDANDINAVPQVIADGWTNNLPSEKLTFDEYLSLSIEILKNESMRQEYEAVYVALAKAQFTGIDENQDGVISREEYRNHVNRYWNNPKNAEEIVEDDFNAIDTNKDGLISLEEFLNWRCRIFLVDDPNENLKNCGWLLPEEDWNEYRKSWDRNTDL